MSKSLALLRQRSPRADRDADDSGEVTAELVDGNRRPPHEWLADIAEGKPVIYRKRVPIRDDAGNVIAHEWHKVEVYPRLCDRIDAAKAAAPYYAPRLMAQKITVENDISKVCEEMRELAKKLPV